MSEMCCTRLAEYTRRKKIAILASSHKFVGLYLRSWGMYRQSGKKFLNADTSSTCPDNMVDFGPLTAETCWRVWGTPANFNDFRVLAALLHGTLVLGVSQTLRRWTEGATYSAGRPSCRALVHVLVFIVLIGAAYYISILCFGAFLYDNKTKVTISK